MFKQTKYGNFGQKFLYRELYSVAFISETKTEKETPNFCTIGESQHFSFTCQVHFRVYEYLKLKYARGNLVTKPTRIAEHNMPGHKQNSINPDMYALKLQINFSALHEDRKLAQLVRYFRIAKKW